MKGAPAAASLLASLLSWLQREAPSKEGKLAMTLAHSSGSGGLLPSSPASRAEHKTHLHVLPGGTKAGTQAHTSLT